MKKIISMILCLVMLLAVMPAFAVRGYTVTVNVTWHDTDSKGASISATPGNAVGSRTDTFTFEAGSPVNLDFTQYKAAYPNKSLHDVSATSVGGVEYVLTTSGSGSNAYANGASFTMPAHNVTLNVRYSDKGTTLNQFGYYQNVAGGWDLKYSGPDYSNYMQDPNFLLKHGEKATLTPKYDLGTPGSEYYVTTDIKLYYDDPNDSTPGVWINFAEGMGGLRDVSNPNNGTGVVTGTSIPIATDYHFYATHYHYLYRPVTYSGNGGAASNGGVMARGGNYFLSNNVKVANNIFLRDGYRFTGWNTSADGTGTAYAAGDTFKMPAVESVTLYAQWEEDLYPITVHYEYADGSEAAPGYTGNVLNGSPYSIVSPEITGYTPGRAIVSGTMPAAPVEETVVYNLNSYTIRYYLNGVLYGSSVLNYGASITPRGTPSLSAGQRFSGWSTIPATMPASDVNVYGTTALLPTYTVTWEMPDGEVLETDTGLAAGAMPQYNSATPVLAGSRFTGWSPEIVAVTGNATYTAQFEEVVVPGYTVIWEMPDGTVLETDTNVPEGTMPTFDANEPEFEGSEFTGWSPVIEPVTGDVTYVAQFEAEIVDPVSPLDPGSGRAWALLNLILTIITGIVSVVMIGSFLFGKRKKEKDEYTEKTTKSKITRLLTLVPFAASVIAFVLTENMRNPMVFVDKWTILMVILAAVSAVTAIIAAKSNKTEKEEQEEPQAK